MSVGAFEVAQILSMVMAAGTPGVTYYVMMRQDKLRVEAQEKHCKGCRAQIDKVLSSYQEGMASMNRRQVDLREVTLPEKYCTKREHDECRKERKEEENSLWTRINMIFNGFKGGP